MNTPATQHEIAKIVERITATWPTGTRGFVWTEALTDAALPFHVLLGVYEHLRDTHDERQPPSPARFRAIARDLTTAHRRNLKPAYTGPPISLDEYLEGLEYRAQSDQRAADELACWGRWRKRGITGALEAQ